MAGVYTLFRWRWSGSCRCSPPSRSSGPVYYHVTHFVPPEFPLLLIVPAIALDLIWPRAARWGVLARALALGRALRRRVFFAVQWPFADFLHVAAARNWFFGTDYFGYYEHPTYCDRQYSLRRRRARRAHFVTVLALAVLAAMLASALGLRARRLDAAGCKR